MLTLRPATTDDLPDVQRLAHVIWHAHYPGIVSEGQIHYMLERGYALDALREFLDEDDAGIEIACIDQERVGFAAWYATDGGEVKLDKLYVLPQYHGQAVGHALIERVGERAKTLGFATVVLNVNKNNAKAIRAYERNGFRIRAAVEVDIGNGYVMDDFVMAKGLG